MGRDASFYCKTCKQWYYLGYGSYGTWLDRCRTVREYDELASINNHGDLQKNQNVRTCLQAHEGHDFEAHSEDWSSVRNGNLYTQTGLMGADELAIEGVGDWDYTDLWEDGKRT